MKMRFKNYDLSLSLPMLRIIEQEDFVHQMQVAESLNINVSTVNVHFRKLQDEGLIKQTERKLLSGRGRPTELWTMERRRNFTVSTIFATPMLHMGLADFSGKVKLQETFDCSELRCVEEIYPIVDSFMQKAFVEVTKVSGVIRYAYAGVPGSLVPETGKVRAAVNMPVLVGLDMEEFFKTRYNITCFADSFAWGLFFGETRNLPENTTAAVIEWDLGVGILFGCGKRIFNFENLPSKSYRYLWDIGHTRIDRNGRKCHCGKRGCIEAYVGGLSIIETLNDTNIKTLPDLISAIESKEENAIMELQKSAYILGKFLTYPIQLLGVERIIFTGLLAEVFDAYKESFADGLKTVFTDEEADALSPSASSDRTANLIAGSCEFARYVFLHPQENIERRKVPSTLGEKRIAVV